jgi:Tol biopolymer transport system component
MTGRVPPARWLSLLFLAGASIACAAARGGTGTAAIVFAADRAPAVTGEIYRLDSNGRRVDLSRSAFEDTVPAVSPNGKLVAFASGRGGHGAIYVVGIDGSRLRRLASPPIAYGGAALAIELAWSPNGRMLGVVSGDVNGSLLSIVGPRRKPRVLARAAAIDTPMWSHDSRLLTATTSGFPQMTISAITPAGSVAWRVSNRGLAPGWSARGLFAATSGGSIHVYDERGGQRFRFAAGTAAWSPDGTRIASLAAGRLEVRTTTGRIVLRQSVAGLSSHNGLVWADRRRVVIGPRDVGVDTVTGKTFSATTRFFGTRSPDGRLVVETAKTGDEFAVKVSPLEGSGTQIYGHVPGCYDDGVFGAAAQSLQFVPGRKSLVYESYCPEPFAALYTVFPAGSGLTRLTHAQDQEVSPSWSPDGSRIVYAQAQYTGLSCKGCPSSLWIADADGSHRRQLTNPVDQYDGSASWSPDGKRIVFSRSSPSSAGALFVIPAAGGTPRSLHLPASQVSWGPARIAYAVEGHDGEAVWTAAPDGSRKRRIAARLARADSLTWSRTGRLAYLAGKRVAVVADGGKLRKVPLPFATVSSLAWSPDGSHFVVSAGATGSATIDVYTVRIDGSGRKRLTKNMNAMGASWR